MKPFIRFISVFAFVWIVLLSGGIRAGEREHALKAGFIFNFVRYSNSSWFESTNSDGYTICSPDPSFINTARETLKGQTISGHPVRLLLIESPVADCHALFITDHMYPAQSYLIKSADFRHTLCIGESQTFISDGGHIRFFIAGGKIRFEVTPDKLRDSGIKLSSKVLRMGRIAGDNR